jgi:hypothetical protein
MKNIFSSFATFLVVTIIISVNGYSQSKKDSLKTGNKPTVVIEVSNMELEGFDCKVQILVNVLKGDYKITTGTTLMAGSSVPLCEESLLFPFGLEIKVGEGGVMLKGKRYSQGKYLHIKSNGDLLVVSVKNH